VVGVRPAAGGFRLIAERFAGNVLDVAMTGPFSRRSAMHTAWKLGAVATGFILALLVDHRAAEAGKVEGVGIGAGVGVIVAGPVGAVVGGVVGYKVGGPNIVSGKRYTCWRDDRGKRRCARR
jgi:hypothetical protein